MKTGRRQKIMHFSAGFVFCIFWSTIYSQPASPTAKAFAKITIKDGEVMRVSPIENIEVESKHHENEDIDKDSLQDQNIDGWNVNVQSPQSAPDLQTRLNLDAFHPGLGISGYILFSNVGGDTEFPFIINVYLSLDQSINTADYKIYSYTYNENLPSGVIKAYYFSTTVSDVPSGNYYVSVIIDVTNAIAESNEDNNWDPTERTWTITTTTDLIVQSVSVTDGTGPDIAYQFAVKNQGTCYNLASFENYIYLSKDRTIQLSDYKIDSYTTVRIKAGIILSSPVMSSSVSGVPNGSYYLGVITDATSAVPESDEGNNTVYAISPMVDISGGGTGPDLIVQSVSLTDGTGPDIAYQFAVRNQGTENTTVPFENKIYLSADTTISSSDYQINTLTIPSNLNAGGDFITPVLNTTVSGVPNGSYYLGVIADATNAVPESNEDNNTGYDGSPMVDISGGGTASDLIVQSVSLTDGTGPDIAYQFVLKNQGSAATANPFVNYVCLSEDSMIDISDYMIDTYTRNSNLNAGASFNTGILDKTVAGIPDGAYYLGVIADAEGAVSESEESNNTGYDSSPKVEIGGTDVSRITADNLPRMFRIGLNYPNPFNSQTLIEYGLPAPSKVVLEIWNSKGECLRLLKNAYEQAGFHSVLWDGKDATDSEVPSGIYICRFHAGGCVNLRKMTLIR
jgi:hypothetical protein